MSCRFARSCAWAAAGAAAEDPVPAAVGAALVRLARTWLEHRLPAAGLPPAGSAETDAGRTWTRAELAWLARALARAQATSPAAADPIHDGASSG